MTFGVAECFFPCSAVVHSLGAQNNFAF